ncbi:MAG: hypothetical protein ACE5MI_14110, partial [Acidimicrobiia bacterium]
EPGLDKWLASLFDDDHLEDTCEILAGASQPDPKAEARRVALLEEIRDCDRRFEQYKAVLDEGADAKIVGRWMADVRRERANLEAQLGHSIPGSKLDKSHVRALVEALQDVVGVLGEADRDDTAELYKELGVEMTYSPEGSVSVRLRPVHPRVLTKVSEERVLPQVHSANHGKPCFARRRRLCRAKRAAYGQHGSIARIDQRDR